MRVKLRVYCKGFGNYGGKVKGSDRGSKMACFTALDTLDFS